MCGCKLKHTHIHTHIPSPVPRRRRRWRRRWRRSPLVQESNMLHQHTAWLMQTHILNCLLTCTHTLTELLAHAHWSTYIPIHTHILNYLPTHKHIHTHIHTELLAHACWITDSNTCLYKSATTTLRHYYDNYRASRQDQRNIGRKTTLNPKPYTLNPKP
jgi:hypothetical protein